MMQQKLSKLVRVNRGWFSCLVRENIKETREKVYSGVQTTQTKGWWPFAPVFLHSKAREIWCFMSSLMRICTPHVVYWCYRYFKLKREHLPRINLVQGCENWCLKTSLVQALRTKRVLCVAPGVLRRQCREYGPLERSCGSRCKRKLPGCCFVSSLADVLHLLCTPPDTSWTWNIQGRDCPRD